MYTYWPAFGPQGIQGPQGNPGTPGPKGPINIFGTTGGVSVIPGFGPQILTLLAPQMGGFETQFLVGGTISNLHIFILGGQPVGGDLTIQVQTNGNPTAMQVIIPSGSPAGEYIMTGTAVVNPGDLFTLYCTTSDPANISAVIANFTMVFQ